jgi:hypothetical protein
MGIYDNKNCRGLGVGDNGWVVIGQEKDWGVIPDSVAGLRVRAKSGIAFNREKTMEGTDELAGGMGPREVDFIDTNHTGTLSVIGKPDRGALPLLIHSAAGHTYNSAAAVGGGVSTIMAAAAVQNATAIKLVDATLTANKLVLLAGAAADEAELVKIKENLTGGDYSITQALRFAHPLSAVAFEAQAPFYNYTKLNNENGCLDSFTAAYFNGRDGGVAYGAICDGLTISSEVAQPVNFEFPLIIKGSLYGVQDAEKAGYVVFSGTASSTTANKLVDSGATFTYEALETGTATSTSKFKLVDSAATFVTDLDKNYRYFIKNTTDNTFAEITAILSETEVKLTKDIMVSGEAYAVYKKVISKNEDLGYSYIVHNTTDDKWSAIIAVDSDTTLTLENDIMASGESYIIYEAFPLFTKSVVDALQTPAYSFRFSQGQFKINGVLFDYVSSFNFNLPSRLEPGHAYNYGNDLSDMPAKRAEELPVTFNLKAKNNELHEKFLREHEISLELEFVNSNENSNLKINIPKLKINAYPGSIESGVIQKEVGAMAYFDSDLDYHFLITYKNDLPSLV